jgi:integrase
MSDDTRRALRSYLELGGPAAGLLFQTTRKGNIITGQGMNERAITGRVAYLGQRAGVAGLSAHDLRHTWATLAARAGTPIDRLMDAGGWSSMAMPLRYVEFAKIANEGVRLE